MYYRNKGAGEDEIAVFEVFVKMSEVPGLNGLENVLTFGDFGSIDKNFRIFQFNFFDGCIVVKAKIAQDLRFVMAEIDSIFFHFAFD